MQVKVTWSAARWVNPEPPCDDRALYGVAGASVPPVFAAPGAWEGQSVGAHMVLAQQVAEDAQRGFALAGEIVKAKLAGLRLMA